MPQEHNTQEHNTTAAASPHKTLAELTAELSSISPDNRITLLRNAVQQGRAYQKSLDCASIDILSAICEWSAFIDAILLTAWNSLPWPKNDEDRANISLVAVGGYGRGELHPHSDIDLLILLREEPSGQQRSAIEAFLTLAWDIKLDIGHSVRTVKECANAAKKDITIMTNLVENRYLTGSAELLTELHEKTGSDYIWPAKEFYQAKVKEQKARHKKHNNTEYNLEPDIKNAPGGLRDLQTIGWITKRYFQTDSYASIITQWFLTEDELALLDRCKDLLWRVRFALHTLTGRDENRLLFNHQRELANLLGYRDSDANLAVEKFMKAYYRCAMEISELNDLILQHFNEAILQNSSTSQITPINSRFQVCNGYIEVTGPETFRKYPSALLEIFVVLAQRSDIAGIRASTMRLIRDHCYLVDKDFRNNPQNNSLFIELLRSPHRLFTQLKRMKRCGLLGQYIPDFNGIVGQMQYDLFHIYTVDAHTLLVIKNMRRFRYPERRREFPVAGEIVERLPKIELLYLAGLFHDLAKGRGGDHSELGADDAEVFCKHHRLTRWDSRLVSWLVRNHLLMSITAQKKDVSDPEVIHEFARQVGDQISLDYLYALTVADICATNPKLWNNWRATLMRQLYRETKRALRRGLENPINKEEWISETKERALILLRVHNIVSTQVEPIWSQMSDDYFMRESADDIAWHTREILAHTEHKSEGSRIDKERKPLILVKKSGARGHEGATQIFVYTEDQPNLFAKSVIAMDNLGLSIQDARIMTSNSNFSLDTYIALDRESQPSELHEQRFNDIKTALTDALEKSALAATTDRLMPRQLKHFNIRTEVFLSNQPDRKNTIIEIRTLDQPGILATVGRVFQRFQILVNNAKITTLGECAEDIFFVTDQALQPINDPKICQSLQDALHAELDQPQKSDTPNGTIEF